MNEKEFIDKYSIGNTPPSDPSRTLMNSLAFAFSVRELVSDGFRGIAEVNASVESNNGILLSTDYTALFFRMLFTYIFGRVYLKIDISEREGAIVIDISADEPLPLDRHEMNMLIKTARNAGMIVENIDGRITTSLEFSNSEEYSVYAGDFFSGKRVMHAALCKIIFC